MDVALSLDISTSVIGWSIIDVSTVGKLSTPVDFGHIDLQKLKNFWTKLDYAEKTLGSIIKNITETKKLLIKHFFVENPVERFRPGLSSAHTIMLLSRFNAVVSSLVRKLLSIDPMYIGATEARKMIGVPLLSKKKANGLDQKIQTFNFLNENVFANYDWPRTRTGAIKTSCYDEADACVIGWAGLIVTTKT